MRSCQVLRPYKSFLDRDREMFAVVLSRYEGLRRMKRVASLDIGEPTGIYSTVGE
jgi:hypothetical protein